MLEFCSCLLKIREKSFVIRTLYHAFLASKLYFKLGPKVNRLFGWLTTLNEHHINLFIAIEITYDALSNLSTSFFSVKLKNAFRKALFAKSLTDYNEK